ncbi:MULTISPECIES: group II intron reverse transcriptase/maturase [Micromonospora]|uniref:Group II intron reverse transcriptase/maturase n=1 Tax=Micromonospora sicca TaxID=2202420 RepID=A0A317DMW7_9ACTN|nr:MULTISPECIES: group II intron reverse transcriptase/maturase [unclassified Micromonospora]MBM0227743.1 group II intron reverse transcriptase/maturase [Micromonospora sp. ATA51]PWR15958.1 group II intron reverse transcriptase/maturase [Micromonospora sp. 4G51]
MDRQKSSEGKPFEISKQEVWEAYRQVKANKGAAGVDGVTIEEFESDLKNNLYRIWNRMSSGSYFPPPVKAVEIPKSHGGGTRVLGVPTVADRIAQTVVSRRLEAKVEAIFHPDSYGYRPRRSALDAVGACRQRCWDFNWVIDLDVEKFFDSVDHALMVKAVQVHTDVPWVVLYVKRWLVAPLQLPDGTLQRRDRGTPQGSAVSPVLANLFMHYAFDAWMAREHPGVPFERYADDAVVHCVNRGQAERLVEAIADRMVQVGLRLHPDKTKIVYCKDVNRRATYEHTAFTFLGYTFRARGARNERESKTFTSFAPAISKEALKKISGTVRRWRLDRKTGQTLADLARWINPIVRGWMQYYGRFNRSALYPFLQRINAYLMRFLRHKFKRVRSFKKAKAGWQRIIDQYPKAFAHWAWVNAF